MIDPREVAIEIASRLVRDVPDGDKLTSDVLYSLQGVAQLVICEALGIEPPCGCGSVGLRTHVQACPRNWPPKNGWKR